MTTTRLQQALGPQHDPGQKVYRSGTHRSSDPQQTLNRIAPRLRAMGITRIADITGLDRIGVPVVMVVRPNSRSLAVSQGKGLSLVSARVSGIMESVETFHAERITRPLTLTDRTTLQATARVVNTDSMAKSGEKLFHDDVRTLWIQGLDLLSSELVWVPYESVHTDFTVPCPSGSGYFPANTNGLASGNCDVEAIAHALYELVERDAMALWHQGKSQDREIIDLDSTGDSDVASLIDRLREADMDVRVWNATSDIGIPCFHCLIMGRDNRFADPEFGSGCHPDRRVALLRAVTEAVQARTTFIAGSRDDFSPLIYAQEQRERRLESCEELMRDTVSRVRLESVPEQTFTTVSDDLEWSLQQLIKRGLDEVIYIDLTLAEFSIPVARVVVPGLEGAYDGALGHYVRGQRAHDASLS